MFNTLKRLLGLSPAALRPGLDPHLAATTLLVEAALADGIYAECEQDQIRDILAAAFRLDPDAAASLLEQAEALAEGAIDHYSFTRVVKASLSEAERIALMEQLWQVALADGESSPFEEAFLRRIAPLLAIDDRERIYARDRARDKTRPR